MCLPLSSVLGKLGPHIVFWRELGVRGRGIGCAFLGGFARAPFEPNTCRVIWAEQISYRRQARR